MVRLRTDRWYGLDGQRRLGRQSAKRVSHSRHLISLGLLLVLILLLMKQVSQPERISQLFSDLGVPLDGPNHASLQIEPTPTRTGEFSQESGTPHQPQTVDLFAATCDSILARLLDDLPQESLDKLSTLWFFGAVSTTDSIQQDQWTWFDRLETLAAQELEEIRSRVTNSSPVHGQNANITDGPMSTDPWQALVTRFEQQWNLLGTQIRKQTSANALRQSPDWDSVFRESLSQILDRLLISAMRDASPWTSREFVSFVRGLQRSRELSHSPALAVAPLLSTYQLESDQSRRGTFVRFRGTVRRVEFIEESTGPISVPEGYWRFWMRGEDNSTQPVAVYTVDTNSRPLQSALNSEPTNFPAVEIRGISSKRLAYAAQSGIEVAPTLFAAQVLLVQSEVGTDVASTVGRPHASNTTWIYVVCLTFFMAMLGPWLVLRTRPKTRLNKKRVGAITKGPVTLIVACFISCSLANLVGGDEKPLVPPWQDPAPLRTQLSVLDRELSDTMSVEATERLREFFEQRMDATLPDNLLRLLFVGRRIGWEAIERVDPETKLVGGRVIVGHWQGLVRQATIEELTESQLDWYAVDPHTKVYRIELEIPESPELLHVFCNSVPSSWLTHSQLRQPCSVKGFAVMQAESAAAQPICVLARQPIWRFDTSQLEQAWQPAVHADHLRLGKAGWNLAWMETIAQRQQMPLTHEEHEAFYSLLNAATKLGHVGNADSADVSPLSAIRQPTAVTGRLVKWPVRIVRGSLISTHSGSSDLQNSHQPYYQLDGFVDLAGQRVEYKLTQPQEPSATQSIEFSGEFPITLVSQQISDEFIDHAAIDSGKSQWDVGTYAIAEGVFYRLWGYHSSQIDELTRNSRQAAPLVVVTHLVATIPPTRKIESGSMWVNWALCLAMLGCLALVWRYALSREPDPRRSRKLR